MTDTLKNIEQKLDTLLEMTHNNARNIYALYRRTTALAHMMESLSEGREPRLPKTIRAEIDASLHPDYFENLARDDRAEFIHRYGEAVLEVLNKRGIDAITKIGDFAPLKSEKEVH